MMDDLFSMGGGWKYKIDGRLCQRVAWNLVTFGDASPPSASENIMLPTSSCSLYDK